MCFFCFWDGLSQFTLGAPAEVYPFSLDYLGPHGTDSVPGKGTTRPYIPQLDPHLSPATREEMCCSKFKACIFQAVLLSPGACMHLKKGGGFVSICFTCHNKKSFSREGEIGGARKDMGGTLSLLANQRPLLVSPAFWCHIGKKAQHKGGRRDT